MRHIPNILSFFRIFLIPLFLGALYLNRTFEAGLILLISGLTDFLDGFLARTFNWISDLGKLLDPLADKLTQTAVSISFLFLFEEYQVFFWILILKEFLMMLISLYFYKRKIEILSAKWFGKVATTAFYIVMIMIVLFPNLDSKFVKELLRIVAGLSVFSFMSYVYLILKRQRKTAS